MASSILEALLGANQEAAAENPYAQYSGIANQVSADLQDQRVVQQYGLKDTAIASLLSGLVGGGLQQLGTNYTDKQSNLYQNALINSMSGNNAMPEGINENLFRKAQQQAKLFKIQRMLQDSSDEAELERLFKSTKAKTKAEKLGELEAYNGEDSSSSSSSLVNPLKKGNIDYVDTTRKEFQAQDAYKNFGKAQTGFQTLIAAKNDPSKISDLDFVYGAIQMIEPGMAVKEGEQAAVVGSQSIPDMLKSKMLGALEGKATLNQETRDSIIRLGARRYEQYRNQYLSGLKGYKGRVKDVTGEDSNDLSFLPDPGDASILVGGSAKSPTSATTPTSPISQLNDIKAKLLAGNLTMEQKTSLLEQARALASAPTTVKKQEIIEPDFNSMDWSKWGK